MNNKKVYALVGASNDPEKYGYKVLNNLKNRGYVVVPVNLKEKKILGLEVSPSLSRVKEAIDIVVFVVPPAVTVSVLHEVKLLGIKKVWLQPGSESSTAIKYCQENNIECVHDACVMNN